MKGKIKQYLSRVISKICQFNFNKLLLSFGILFLSQTASALVVANNSSTPNISGAVASAQFYSITVPAGASNLVIKIAGTAGDADLYVKFGTAPTLSVYDFRPYIGGSNETVTIATPSAGLYHIMIVGYSAYSGVTLTVSYTDPAGNGGGQVSNIPSDTNGFLQFLNKTAPRNNELTNARLTSAQNNAGKLVNVVNEPPQPQLDGVIVPPQQLKDAGQAYYTAIDPNNRRSNLAAFKAFNNNLSDATRAVYVNDADLGFGRRMYLTVNPGGSVSSCVENYAEIIPDPNDPTKQIVNVDGPAHTKLSLAAAGDQNLVIATVCMEYSGTPGTGTSVDALKGRKYVKFFSYGKNGVQIKEANLDGRGNRTQPGLCNTCHGGQGSSLLPNGTYPDNGDTRAQFLPWDLDTFVYAEDPTLSVTQNVALNAQARQNLESILKQFNTGVLATYPQPQTFSFTGNVTIPLNSTTSTTNSNIDLPINVSGMNDPITSVVVSIDEVSGSPGVSFTDAQFLRFELVTPGNNVMRLRISSSTNNTANVPYSGIKNFYLADDAGSYSQNVKIIASNLSGVMQGVSVTTTVPRNRFVYNEQCKNGFVAETSVDLGCSDATGVWKLRITNLQNPNQTPQFTGVARAWSIHFNGIPDGAYTPAPVELIRGWYGGKTLPLTTFDSNFIPNGWKAVNNSTAPADTGILYIDVIGPTCRACHAQRGTLARNEIDFSTYDKFMLYSDRIKSLVYDKAVMPMALRTYKNHFWNIEPNKPNKPDILSQHIIGSSGLQPGRNIANAGHSRRGSLAVLTGSTVKLNGRGSLFPNNFLWTIRSPAQAVFTKTGVTPTFIASESGIYVITLDTNGNAVSTNSTRSTVRIETSPSVPTAPISFRNDISKLTSTATNNAFDSCATCHSTSAGESVQPRRFITGKETATASDFDEYYRVVRDRIDLNLPFDSLMMTKGLNINPHDLSTAPGPTSTKWSTFPSSPPSKGNIRYNLFERWLFEGALNN